MSRPEIPGFYFDETRKRYFKITNGDQRHNAAYSNNSVRAQERRKEHKETDRIKRSKPANRFLDASLIAEKQRCSSSFYHWLLKSRLAYILGHPGLINRISSSSSTIKLIEAPAWSFGAGKRVLVANGPLLKLHTKLDFLQGCISQPIATLNLSEDERGTRSTDRKIDSLTAKGIWVACFYGCTFHLLQWRWNETETECQPRDFTDRFNSSLVFYNGQNAINTLREILDSRLFPIFEENLLSLYLDKGYRVILSLDPFYIRVVDRFYFTPSPQISSTFMHVNNTVFYNSGKHLMAHGVSSTPQKWKFNFPVYAYDVVYLDGIESRRDQGIIRLFVITAKEVIIRDLSDSLGVIGPDICIPISNDNQARPLVSRQGQYVVVEEGDGILKLIDTKFLSSKTLNLNMKFTSPRDTMPRMFELGTNVILADAKNTYKIRMHDSLYKD
ncbi:hypothetical protein METBIDRAFT_93560 [Metschnikowia bicuspidata var. bicuspidata NRRL YB-4993]|uniref:Uncharacterized protein n=1 Tax=Metschnikowia bicuspidata var. bicuspidata NRRL YB-4993 TaxID=869754 RepID=A0A1A0HFS3_9ASCO|nr:hypothetical protein METBIDRAFT_93560 [Metschnikowia bicuspidata var. bicuspidata NRRL YB-4993]OBA22851.1 hypothetical protein METBIDRAFT_93560 [Metschnikowia bicuspidata var. bicuspidata NRRL YB-4993]